MTIDNFLCEQQLNPPEQEVQSDGTLEYEIERIENVTTEYSVKWKGNNASNETRESANALHEADDLGFDLFACSKLKSSFVGIRTSAVVIDGF